MKPVVCTLLVLLLSPIVLANGPMSHEEICRGILSADQPMVLNTGSSKDGTFLFVKMNSKGEYLVGSISNSSTKPSQVFSLISKEPGESQLPSNAVIMQRTFRFTPGGRYLTYLATNGSQFFFQIFDVWFGRMVRITSYTYHEFTGVPAQESNRKNYIQIGTVGAAASLDDLDISYHRYTGLPTEVKIDYTSIAGVKTHVEITALSETSHPNKVAVPSVAAAIPRLLNGGTTTPRLSVVPTNTKPTDTP